MDPNQKQNYENASEQSQVADTSSAIAQAIAEHGIQSVLQLATDGIEPNGHDRPDQGYTALI
jgi:hypothetical protein